MNLSTALRNIHADRLWWRKVLIGGALNLSLFGAPWTAGFVVESMDNVRNGFPSPLPPNVDPGTRYTIGLLALVIDFYFFLLPLVLIGILVGCGIAALTLGQVVGRMSPALASGFVIGIVAVYEGLMFAFGVAPVGRLLYVHHGGVERALSAATVRTALARTKRQAYSRARLLSIPAYIPLLLLAGGAWASSSLSIPGQQFLTVLVVWLALSALVYAHLVVAQLYGDAERLLGQTNY